MIDMNELRTPSEGEGVVRSHAHEVVESIPMTMRVVIGSATLSLREVKRLRPGMLVTLDRKLGHPVEITINDRLICRGEIGVTNDDEPRFVVRIVDLVDSERPEPARP